MRLIWMPKAWRRRPAPAPAPAAPPPPPEPIAITGEDREKMRLLLSLVTDTSQPNINDLLIVVRNLDALALNVKAMGYDLARRLADTLAVPRETTARHVGLAAKLSVQRDIESDWLAHWCGELKIPILAHRKLWEFAYVLQALHDGGCLAPGGRGLGFGCGLESIPSYLTAHGVAVTITDLPPDDPRAIEWSNTAQHATDLEQARASHLVDRETFHRLAERRYVDMNAIPDDLTGYDFCWSICALEHLGSIAQGLDFIENSLKTLRTGGTAVHTLEYNINPDGPTIDNWPTVLFQRKHLEELAGRLRAQGHTVAPFDFDPGDRPLDHFIDLPPWHEGTKFALADMLGQSYHLKVGYDGFVATCFGIIVTKAGG